MAVRGLAIGRAVDDAGAVVSEADSFGPQDTVYLSVLAEGDVDRAVLSARWTRDGEILVDETQRVFPLAGRRTVTFHLADPGGLPAGEYAARVLLGSDGIGSRSFRVVGAAGTAESMQEVDP